MLQVFPHRIWPHWCLQEFWHWGYDVFYTLSSGSRVLLHFFLSLTLSLFLHIFLPTVGRASGWPSRGSRWLQREAVRVWLWLLLLVREPRGTQLCIAGGGERHLVHVYPQHGRVAAALMSYACRPDNPGIRVTVKTSEIKEASCLQSSLEWIKTLRASIRVTGVFMVAYLI